MVVVVVVVVVVITGCARGVVTGEVRVTLCT